MRNKIVWDDFSGSSLTLTGVDAKWFYFSSGNFVADDGVVVVGGGQLKISAPVFRKTVPQDGASSTPHTALPGSLDHCKWLAYTNHRASTGVPGFDAPVDAPLIFSVDCCAQTFATAHHPFGNAVANHGADVRLACGAFALIDFETMMVFDFVLTSRAIYALYERLPYAREKLGHYAAFSYAVPVAERNPNDWSNLVIEYDRSAGRVRWEVNQTEVFSVDQIGHRIDRKYMGVDGGGTEQTVQLQQLNAGFALLTLLDAASSDGPALVKLSGPSYEYFDTRKGAPFPQQFVDNESKNGSRLFGQGAALSVKNFAVTQ